MGISTLSINAMIRRAHSESGITIVENLVAMSIVLIAIIGATSLFITAFYGNASSRSYTTLVSDVHTIIDSYRDVSYSSLLGKFGADSIAISDGAQVSESSTSADARADYTTTFTAIKTHPDNIPEAVRIQVSAVQRRGKFDDMTYQFETIIAQTK